MLVDQYCPTAGATVQNFDSGGVAALEIDDRCQSMPQTRADDDGGRGRYPPALHRLGADLGKQRFVAQQRLSRCLGW